jgi:hypothetical protein
MSVPLSRIRRETPPGATPGTAASTATGSSPSNSTASTSRTATSNSNVASSNASSGARKVPTVNTRLASFVSEDYFGHQPATTHDLPDPRVLAENLARSVLEILAGARELDQIARWVTDEVFQHLLKRVHISQRARTLKNVPAHRPSFRVGRTLVSHPAEGIVEAVVIIHGKARTRSVAIRLEGMDSRWRASAVHVL